MQQGREAHFRKSGLLVVVEVVDKMRLRQWIMLAATVASVCLTF
jgi:hypothetical protein